MKTTMVSFPITYVSFFGNETDDNPVIVEQIMDTSNGDQINYHPYRVLAIYRYENGSFRRYPVGHAKFKDYTSTCFFQRRVIHDSLHEAAKSLLSKLPDKLRFAKNYIQRQAFELQALKNFSRSWSKPMDQTVYAANTKKTITLKYTKNLLPTLGSEIFFVQYGYKISPELNDTFYSRSETIIRCVAIKRKEDKYSGYVTFAPIAVIHTNGTGISADPSSSIKLLMKSTILGTFLTSTEALSFIQKAISESRTKRSSDLLDPRHYIHHYKQYVQDYSLLVKAMKSLCNRRASTTVKIKVPSVGEKIYFADYNGYEDIVCHGKVLSASAFQVVLRGDVQIHVTEQGFGQTPLNKERTIYISKTSFDRVFFGTLRDLHSFCLSYETKNVSYCKKLNSEHPRDLLELKKAQEKLAMVKNMPIKLLPIPTYRRAISKDVAIALIEQTYTEHIDYDYRALQVMRSEQDLDVVSLNGRYYLQTQSKNSARIANLKEISLPKNPNQKKSTKKVSS